MAYLNALRITLRNVGAQGCQKGLDVLESPPLVSLPKNPIVLRRVTLAARRFFVSSEGHEGESSFSVGAAHPSLYHLGVDSRAKLDNQHASGRLPHPVHP